MTAGKSFPLLVMSSVVSPTHFWSGRSASNLRFEQVGSDRLVVVAHRGALEPLPDPGLEPLLLDVPDDALAAHVDAVDLGQLGLDARAAIGPAASLVRLPDEEGDLLVLERVRRRRATHEVVVPAPGDLEDTAQHLDRELGHLGGDEGELHRWCFAK